VRRLPAAALALAVAAGCTLGPDPGRAPRTAADGAGRWAGAPPTEAQPDDAWWTRFGDPVTSQLVRRALEANPDVHAAAARVLEAEARLAQATGARWPQADVTGTASRTKFSFVLPRIGRVGIYSTTFNEQLQVSYQLDLFGRLRRTAQAAWAELLATEADRRAVINSLVAQVIRTRVEIATLERRLEVARRAAASWRASEESTRARYEAGLADAAELASVRAGRAAAEAAVPRLERALAEARTALDVLVGRRPGSAAPPPPTLPDLPDLEPVPAGVPAALLDRRPDLVAARQRFAAATARIGVALAALYPSLTITASGGVVGDRIQDLTDSAGLIYSAALNLLQPLFRGGQLRAEVRAARARAEQAAATYAGAVLRAMKEVEDALAAEDALRRELASAEAAREAAADAERLARWRYERGLVDLPQLLAAQRQLAAAEDALLLARQAIWEARVALHLALGGDWEAAARPEPEG